jgi:hypothetical protein
MNAPLKSSILVLITIGLFACGPKDQDKTSEEAKDSVVVSVPVFDADSAYHYTKTQVDFGPRVPNSKAHEACGDYLIQEMTRFGGQLTVQKTDITAWDGKVLKARNIIASFNPESTTRILLLAHWDCRPWSDNDPNPANRMKPVDGANDAASGVAVLMEIARQLQAQKPTVGVDILFTDMEDYGEPAWYKGEKTEDSWCLGTQYWAKNPHVPGYHARYGILLDMVGAPNATFPKEGYSMNYASHVVEKVWNEAKANGFDTYFIEKQGGMITDDHLPVNQLIGVPTIDIIHYNDNGFGNYWHTQDDTMRNIDKATLKAVGQTVLGVIYKEKE